MTLNPNTRFYLTTTLFLVMIGNVLSQAQNKVLSLENGEFVQVTVCTDNIFRIRASKKNDFPESLMERYGIVKTDWKPSVTNLEESKGNYVIKSRTHELNIDRATGSITVNRIDGGLVIEQITFGPGSKALKQSLDTYFETEKEVGNIIGDGNSGNPKTEKDNVGKSGLGTTISLSVRPEERFYGGGATSRKNIQHRGEALRIWTMYQKTEIPIPFLMSSSGWGIYNNTTSLNFFDVGRFRKDRLLAYNTDEGIDFYLMLGSSMDQVLNQYTTITKKPYLMPKWAYGLAFGGNMMEDQLDVMNDAIRFRDEKIPCDIFWLEPQWMAKKYDFSTSKNWNLDKFPAEPFWEINDSTKYENRELFVSKLHNLGFKLALWLCIDHDLSIEEEDHLAEKAGKPQSGKEHWFPHLTKFMDQGVDGFKLDPGRTLDEHPDRKYYNGYTDKEMHNLNQILLPKQMYETFREHNGIRSFHHYCGGYAGTQHWGASTSGDNGGGKDALFDQINLGLSGFMNTSADVMEAISDNKAGIHFGFFLPWVQVNSWYSLLHPWYLKPDEKETFRYYAQLRNSLSPYIYSAALKGSQTGMPILRAMPLVFSDDRKVDNMIYQYMFGENLLVGVFSDSIYLPKGSWINYWTGEKQVGGKTIHSKVPKNRGGLLFIKDGAIIPYQKTKQYIREQPEDTLIVRVFPVKYSSYVLWEDDGRSFDFEKGNIAKTQFECLESDEKTEFIIHPREGFYTGISNLRAYQLEIDFPSKPIYVLLNGSKIVSWEYVSSGKVILTVNQGNLLEKQVIEILKD